MWLSIPCHAIRGTEAGRVGWGLFGVYLPRHAILTLASPRCAVLVEINNNIVVSSAPRGGQA